MLSLTKTVPLIQRSTQKGYYAFANQHKFQRGQISLQTRVNEITNIIKIATKPEILPRLMTTVKRPGIRQAAKLQIYLGHSGEITDAYIPPSNYKLWTIQGWKDLWYRFRSMTRNVQAWNQLRNAAKKQNTKYTNKQFAIDATEMYKKIHTAVAEGSADIVRSNVTEKFYSQLKPFVAAAAKLPGKIECEVNVNKAKIVSLRTLITPRNDTTFVQILTRFDTVQKMQATKDGKVIKSSEPTAITEYCVFERNILNPNSPWKMIGKVKPEELESGNVNV